MSQNERNFSLSRGENSPFEIDLDRNLRFGIRVLEIAENQFRNRIRKERLQWNESEKWGLGVKSDLIFGKMQLAGGI